MTAGIAAAQDSDAGTHTNDCPEWAMFSISAWTSAGASRITTGSEAMYGTLVNHAVRTARARRDL